VSSVRDRKVFNIAKGTLFRLKPAKNWRRVTARADTEWGPCCVIRVHGTLYI